MSIYFDNSATTRIDNEVLSAMNDCMEEYYANPSAMHRLGYLAEEEIKKSNKCIADLVNCDSSEIVWTSGGTESNNLAISGYLEAHKGMGNRIITTKIEHPSVYNVFKKYQEKGYDVVCLDVDKTGHIYLEDLKKNINDKTALVSIMYVNNEIGSVQKIDEIGSIIKSINRNCAFHVDFVQGFGKYRIDVKKCKIDFFSISSHKFNGPKGIGVLYKNKNIQINPIIIGGGQQNALRSGTLNLPGIVGTAKAAKIAYDDLQNVINRLQKIKNYLIDELFKINEKYGIITINTLKDDTFAPHIVSVAFQGIRSEVMLHAFEDREIYVSAGSACASHNKKVSNTLIGIGLSKEIAESTIRVSFDKYNEIEEVDTFIKVLNEIIPKLKLK